MIDFFSLNEIVFEIVMGIINGHDDVLFEEFDCCELRPDLNLMGWDIQFDDGGEFVGLGIWGGFDGGVERMGFFGEGGKVFVGGRTRWVHVDFVIFVNEDQLAEILLVADMLQIDAKVETEVLVVLLS